MKTAFDAHCWAEIDLDALVHNFHLIREKASPAAVCAVVKADAYGHGDRMAARTLAETGAAWFAVSSLAEARHLRRSGIKQPILILGMTRPECAGALAAEGITQAVYSLEYARALSQAAEAAGVTVEGHLKIDTGMGRIGFGACRDFEGAVSGLLECRRLRGLSITGAFQHFPVADSLSEEDRRYTEKQYALFRRVVERLEAAGPLRTVHCSNSAGLTAHPEWSGDMVRAGVILYGQDPSAEVAFPGLRPVMALKTVVSQVKDLAPGDCVGYGRTYTADRPLRAATVCCGYADGYPRCLSNLGTASIHGHPAPVIGRVSMDQIVLDASQAPEVSAGDEAVLLGAAPADGFAQAAEKAGTITYELLCAVARRVPRVYLRGGEVVEVLDYLDKE
ncbi:MAG: alanine racemase [Oscillibacter sp.]|jgi:alanine racemase|uniref:alanine racemase n=1 Tax=uncultured Oscillibacter sp. TaxID=876091 RepID=UPI00217003B7|nr:alanine racemase [uncultured Oscillibacter sp.]MCI9300266.1 alanine racemase [Oscillibacter sp.]MCI9460501.1 alanine racemase [Oscillibacter sp.]